MNRTYDSKKLDYVLKSIRSLSRPDQKYISIGADIITGFD
jgi:tRNA A37 methylthiotransferase MiaB